MLVEWSFILSLSSHRFLQIITKIATTTLQS